MMIHGALRWNYVSEKSLWPMNIDHYFHLHYHTPHIYSGMSPDEVCTRSKSSYSALQNYHPWGCHAYVLEPRL